MNSFEDLDVYKECSALRNSIWEFSKKLHKEETFRLKDQLIRASRSVTANIAEGYGRFHYQENIQFCRQARGSVYETLDHLICAFDCGYLTESEMNNFREKIIICLKMLNGYISYLKKAKESTT
ncbi:MAG: four helix bundle protein [Bacteroidales bacterium]